jgi:hypothetical protein
MKHVGEGGQGHLDGAVIDGDEHEPKRHLPQNQPSMGALRVREIRFRHGKK